MKPKQILAGVGIMVGMIIGSGVFALPYVVANSGLWLGLIAAIWALFLAWVMHHAYAEIVLRTPKKHRLPGYVRYYLGPIFGGFETILLLVSFHAILLSYALLAGLFASQLWVGSEIVWTVLFFVLMAILLLRPAKSIGEINFVLLLPFVLMVLGIGIFGFASGSFELIPYPSNPNLFPVFATFLFALTGYSVVPDSLSVLGSKPTVHGARKIISIATFLPFILYVPFIIGVLMLSGSYVSEDALSGLVPALGVAITGVGAFVGLLAVVTSYLSLGFDLRNMYQYDYNVPKIISWLLVVTVPAIPYLLGYHDYIKVLSFVGGFLIAIDGVFIMLSLLIARQRYPHHHRILSLGTISSLAVTLGFLSSAVYFILTVI